MADTSLIGKNQPGTNNDMNQTDLVSGSYEVTITDALGCETRATIPVGDEGDQIDLELVEQLQPACPLSEDGMIAVMASGGVAPYSYEWNNTPGDSSLTDLNEGVYNVVVTDANGCSASGSYTLEALGALDLEAPNDTIVCAEMVTVSAFSSGADTYEWFDADGNLIGTGQTIDLPVGIDPEQIAVVASNAFGCTLTDSFTVAGDPLEVDTNPISTTACIGADTPLDGLINNPNPDYTWDWMPDSLIASGDGTPNPIFLSNTAGSIEVSVVVENLLGCVDTFSWPVVTSDPNIIPNTTQNYDCQDLTVEFEIGDFPGAIWDFDDNGATASGTAVVHTFSEPGDYNVSLTFDPELACVDEIIVPITVDEVGGNAVTAGPDQNVCSQDFVTLTAQGANGANVEWFDDMGNLIGTGETLEVEPLMPEADPLMIIVSATDALYNCSSSDTILIANLQPLAQLMPPAPNCIDEGGAAEVSVSAQSAIITDYSWSSDNPDMILETGAEPSMVSYSNAADGDLIFVELSNAFCTIKDSIEVEVIDVDMDVDLITDPLEIVLGNDVNFELVNPSGYDVDWNVDVQEKWNRSVF